MSRWIYAKVDEPMWELTDDGLEQAVMFFDADSPGFPPMSDADWVRLETASRRRSLVERRQYEDELDFGGR